MQDERQEDVVDDGQTTHVGETVPRRYELEIETLQWHIETPVGLWERRGWLDSVRAVFDWNLKFGS